jgi:hypothetical protein
MRADRIMVIDHLPACLELAQVFGADYLLSLPQLRTPEQRIDTMKDLTGSFGADL